jgi:hypothetical protein
MSMNASFKQISPRLLDALRADASLVRSILASDSEPGTRMKSQCPSHRA